MTKFKQKSAMFNAGKPQYLSKTCPQSPQSATQIFLVGNPNAGKSTIFNKLTRSNVHTGNWNGVTVNTTTRVIVHRDKKYCVTDLPGVYSLTPFSQDEANAINMIDKFPDAIWVNIVDCNTLAKSLHLTLQLIDKGLKVVLVPNFMTKASRRGLSIDYNTLGKMLGIPVCVLDIKDRNFVVKFFDFLDSNSPRAHFQSKKTPLARSKIISQILTSSTVSQPQKPYAYSRLDKLFTNRYLGIPIFLIFMLGVFWLTFGAFGSFLSETVVLGWELFAKLISNCLVGLHAPDWVIGFVNEAVLNSIGGIIGFLPQICLLWLCLEFIEQSGYISRVVWLLESILGKLGLSGKSIFPLLLGFGCTTLATPTVLAIKSTAEREKTASILPYITCNAKLPVLLCVASAIFPQNAFWVVFAMYVLGVAVAISVACIWQKFQPSPIQNEIFEFTPLCLPSVAKLLSKTMQTAVRFLRKIWSVVLIFGIIIWFMSNFDFALQQVKIEQSILASFAQLIAPIFAPLGLGWGCVVALVIGVVAKEMVLSSMAVLNGSNAICMSLINPNSVIHFDMCSGVAFLVFVCLYTPCISALTQLRAVLPRRKLVVQILTQFGIAYLFSLISYMVTKSLLLSGVGGVIWAIIISIIVIMLAYWVLTHLFARKKCDRNCNFCNRM